MMNNVFKKTEGFILKVIKSLGYKAPIFCVFYFYVELLNKKFDLYRSTFILDDIFGISLLLLISAIIAVFSIKGNVAAKICSITCLTLGIINIMHDSDIITVKEVYFNSLLWAILICAGFMFLYFITKK